MKGRILFVVGLLAVGSMAVVLTQGYTQQPVPIVTPGVPAGFPVATAAGQQPVPQGVPFAPQPVSPAAIPGPPHGSMTPGIRLVPPTPAPQPVPEKSLDVMLDVLEALRGIKAELEKKEQELIKAIQQKADKQGERMKRLGVAKADIGNGPKRVGRIFLEGVEEETEETILKTLPFHPGKVLEYPSLDLAREKLLKAGYKRVSVEVLPGQLDSQFVDILIKLSKQDS